MASNDILSSLGLDQLIAEDGIGRDETGILFDPAGARVVFASAEMMRSVRHVLERESAGSWQSVMKASGHVYGQKIATNLDARLAAIGKPKLAALPLEACLVFIERYFALHGWGRLMLDLKDAAEHGLVIARLDRSYFVEALAKTNEFVDPVLAGMLQGFFEHISGQSLGCEEVACALHADGPCTFVVTGAERLATLGPRIGQETAEALIARLRN